MCRWGGRLLLGSCHEKCGFASLQGSASRRVAVGGVAQPEDGELRSGEPTHRQILQFGHRGVVNKVYCRWSTSRFAAVE